MTSPCRSRDVDTVPAGVGADELELVGKRRTRHERLDATFAALADRTRRAILARLASSQATVQEVRDAVIESGMEHGAAETSDRLAELCRHWYNRHAAVGHVLKTYARAMALSPIFEFADRFVTEQSELDPCLATSRGLPGYDHLLTDFSRMATTPAMNTRDAAHRQPAARRATRDG